MKHVWSIICNKLIVDEETKNATLVDVLEEIKINKEFLKDKNEIPLLFDLVSLWCIEEEKDTKKETSVLIEFYDPKNNKLNDFLFTFTPPERKKRIRTSIKFSKFLLNGSGIYAIKIKQDNKKITEIPLEINIT